MLDPHCFLNCINIIYSLNYVAKVADRVIITSRHTRYVLLIITISLNRSDLLSRLSNKKVAYSIKVFINLENY